MWSKCKAHLARVEVRFGELLALALMVLPDLLDTLGAVDLGPVMRPIFGDAWAAKYTPLIVLAVALMRPLVHVHPHRDDR